MSAETLRKTAAPGYVPVMLADPEISVWCFFERPDREMQFLYQLIIDEPDTEKAMEDYHRVLKRINSREKYDHFLNSGFPVILRDDNRDIEETLKMAEDIFGFCRTKKQILFD